MNVSFVRSARGGGPTARAMTDEWQRPIRPANLTSKWLFENGHTPLDLRGLDGTPTGSYVRPIAEGPDRWAIVAYVLSLSPPSRPVLHLADFAHDRAERIGLDGLVRAPLSP